MAPRDPDAIQDAGHFRYDLSLNRPWATAKGRSTVRSGYLLWIRTRDGRLAYGDAATLPAAAGEGLLQIGRELDELLAHVRRRGVEVGVGPPPEVLVRRNVRHAWTQAVLTLEALAKRRTLAAHLSRRLGRPVPLRRRIVVNATLPIAPEKETIDAAQRAVREGYRTLKLKVASNTREIRRVAAVRDAVGPRVRIRLDANGGWDATEARQYLRRLEPLGIEYVEQPLPPGQVGAMMDLHRDSPVPLAADESADNVAHATALLRKKAFDVLVIKPMRVGGVDRALELVEAAKASRVRVVITDALESAVGRTAALHVAALLGRDAPACGLAGGEWFEKDVVPHPPLPRRGFLALPPGRGLGLERIQRTAAPP